MLISCYETWFYLIINCLFIYFDLINHVLVLPKGADFVEMDVQLTKDHKVVVYHDFETVIISKKVCFVLNNN